MNTKHLRVLSHLDGSTQPFQLVKHYKDVHDKYKTFPVWAEVKYDGVFCAVIASEGQLDFLSRTGKLFYSELNKIMYPLVPHEEGVWIGELCNKNCSLEVLSGLVNPNRVTPWSEAEQELMRSIDIHFHEALTFDEALAGYSPVPQQHRLQRLPWYVYPAEGKMLYSQDEITKFSDECIANNLEGIVIKRPQDDYLAGHKGYRVTKIVRDIHVDLMCLDVQTGKGKRTGQIARLQFKYKGKVFWADLGEGWTDNKRIALTEHWHLCTASSPISKIFHVKALQESSKGVLRLPKVQEMRIDKLVEDVL